MNSQYKIGDISRLFNLSSEMIRYYEKMGIIKPVKVDPKTKYRYYSADQVQQLDAVLELKQLGFSLAEIKRLLDGGMENEKFMEALVHKKMSWQNIVFSAENKISAIDTIITRMSASRPVTKLDELSREERAWMLVKMVCVEDLQAQSVLSEAVWL